MAKQNEKAKRIVESVCQLLSERTPFDCWPCREMGFLNEALECQWEEGRAQSTAFALGRHLFGNTSPRALPQGAPVDPAEDLPIVALLRECVLSAVPERTGLEILREQRRRRNNPWGFAERRSA